MTEKTLLLATARNEAPYLVEWIAYHRALRFDSIMLVTNSNTDGSDSLITALEQASVITHIDNSSPEGLEHFAQYEKDNIQIRAYMRAFHTELFHQHDWVCILDIDEFLVFKTHATIAEFVAGRDADAIAINWLNFGSSGLVNYEDIPVIERFRRCAPPNWRWNAYIKSISRVPSIRKLAGAHYPFLKTGKDKFIYCSGEPVTCYHDETKINYHEAQVNHYAIKSLSEFQNKRSRGDGLKDPSLDSAGSKYNSDYFITHDKNENEDDTILRFRQATGEQIRFLMSLPGVANAHTASVEQMTRKIRFANELFRIP